MKSRLAGCLLRVLSAAFAPIAASAASAHAATKPNRIVVVTDDQANWTLGCYGGPDAVTPHLDPLARDGARFTSAFTATPVCSPSRATHLAIAGVPVPAGVAHEGVDFMPLLRGATQPARATVFAQYDLHNTSYARLRSARTERWKLVRRFDGQRLDELYDLAADPEERKNLIVPGAITVSTLTGEPARARADLDAQLLAWMRAIDDPVLPAAGSAGR